MFACTVSLHDFLRQQIILLTKFRKIFLLDCIWLRCRCNNRLNRNLLKSFIRKAQHVCRKIFIEMRKCTSDIIIRLMSALGKLLELRHDQIIAAAAVAERTHIVMDFLTSIHTQNNIRHFFIAEFHDLIIQQDTIRRQCESKILVMNLLLLTAILNETFNHIPVHQRLAAEEIHFQIPPVA